MHCIQPANRLLLQTLVATQQFIIRQITRSDVQCLHEHHLHSTRSATLYSCHYSLFQAQQHADRSSIQSQRMVSQPQRVHQARALIYPTMASVCVQRWHHCTSNNGIRDTQTERPENRTNPKQYKQPPPPTHHTKPVPPPFPDPNHLH